MLKISNLYKKFVSKNEKEKSCECFAVNNISFTIEKPQVVAIFGKNGAGKTTLLKLLSGLLDPTEGSISIDNFIPYEKKYPYLKKISLFMNGKFQLEDTLTSYDFYLLEKEIYDLPKDKFEANLKMLLSVFDVNDLLYKNVAKLSLGQRVKMELIISFLHSPKYLYLDEPTNGLDSASRKRFYAFVKQYVKQNNAYFFFASHNIEDINNMANRLLVLEKGLLIDNRVQNGHKFL